MRSTRPVRALLIRGASRKTTDSKNKRPIDMAEEISILELRNELKSMLKPPSNIQKCLMIKTPLKKMKKNTKTSFIFLFLFCVCYFIVGFIVFPCNIFEFNSIDCKNDNWFIVISALFGVVILLFILSWLVNPGYLKKPTNANFLVIYSSNKMIATIIKF